MGEQFVEYYYKTFDSNRADLAGLYGQDSMLTFEAAPCQGVANIVTKLQDLPFQRVEHQVTTLDAQPADTTTGAILVIVSGVLLVEEEKRPMSFAQTFQLKPREGSYYVFNDIFRLVYPAA
ncbi:Nuclear transport factor 2 [Recurvomyces mirabilis]|uniref:Nuclear transport factor 2 n=1 Tax=Recurvomyces mirabilis TaxID=574656 RepID=A0AAE0WWH2_9PEZI|nr:Nuclear transport factor 2 [Recurvomyces mirabilis]KAK5158817.1 Nuclear transport factor 2 [Recurvomyces mirabilis]